MTKREFFENELKMTPSEVGSAVPMNVDGEQEVTEAWLMAFVKHLAEDLKEAKKWHTEMPTEYGLYLVQYIHGGYDVVLYDLSGSGWDIYSDDSPKDIVKWQKIEERE